ncbi:MAG: ROK family protein [Gammaproteobacteria bacterium]|jgi:glucokinase|nr:ROK family protein [Gammaproteobacteria bacterium]
MTGAGAVRIGVDVGGTHVRVGVIEGLRVVWEDRFAAHFARHCRADDPEGSLAHVLRVLGEAVAEALREYPGCAGVGLAVPGFLDPASGRLISSPNIPGVRDADLAGPLAASWGIPVVAENDALAAAYGEWALHPERPQSLAYLGLGTGVGGGLVLDGHPYRGSHGVAMEVGHLTLDPGGRACGCGNRGCLERYASASGVALSYQETAGLTLEAREIAQQAREGDPRALAAFAVAGEMLARATAHILKVADVTHVVVGGGLAASWDLIEPAFSPRIEADLIPVLRGRVAVSVSRAGDQAGMIGAALLAGPAAPLTIAGGQDARAGEPA